jgi:uncharacterized protein
VLIGLISDTHGLLRPEVFAAFARVEHILHAGDVGDPDILLELEALAPLTAVWGNTDGREVRRSTAEIATVNLGGALVKVVHGQQHGSPTARQLALHYADVDLLVFGHSHKPEIERVGRVLAVNPGSAGPRRLSLPVTVALARVTEGAVSAEIVPLLHEVAGGG